METCVPADRSQVTDKNPKVSGLRFLLYSRPAPCLHSQQTTRMWAAQTLSGPAPSVTVAPQSKAALMPL